MNEKGKKKRLRTSTSTTRESSSSDFSSSLSSSRSEGAISGLSQSSSYASSLSTVNLEEDSSSRKHPQINPLSLVLFDISYVKDIPKLPSVTNMPLTRYNYRVSDRVLRERKLERISLRFLRDTPKMMELSEKEMKSVRVTLRDYQHIGYKHGISLLSFFSFFFLPKKSRKKGKGFHSTVHCDVEAPRFENGVFSLALSLRKKKKALFTVL